MAEATDAAAELRKAWEWHNSELPCYPLGTERRIRCDRDFLAAATQHLPAVLDRLDALEKERRWVPVSERLPDANVNDWSLPVLCNRPGIGLFVDSVYRRDNGERFWGKGLEYDRWLPLPVKK